MGSYVNSHIVLIGSADAIHNAMDDVIESPATQRFGDEFHTRTMDRSINYLEIGMTFDDFGVKRKCLDCCEESFVDSIADDFNLRGVAGKFDVLDILDAVDMVDDVHIVRRDNLCAVAPICLVTVVDFRIV